MKKQEKIVKTYGSLQLEKTARKWYATDLSLNDVQSIKATAIRGSGSTQEEAITDFAKNLLEIHTLVEKVASNLDEVLPKIKD